MPTRPTQGQAQPWAINGTDGLNPWLDVGHNSDGTTKPMGGGATKVIAANDSPAAYKARADVICTGTADQTAINALMGVPGDYMFGPGNFNFAAAVIPTVDGVTIRGSGIATVINSVGNTVLFDVSGTNSANHRQNFILRDMKLNGAGSSHTLPLVRCYYSGPNQLFENLWVRNSGGAGIEGMEWWDARLNNLWFDNLGLALGANSEALRIVSTKEGVTAGNFGYSTDSPNNMWAQNLLFTSNRQGDILISRNGGSNSPHRMYFQRAKFESQNVRNAQPMVKMDTIAFSSFRDFNLHPVSFDSGQSTVVDCFDLNNTATTAFDNILLENNPAIFRTVFKIRGGCNVLSFKDILAEGAFAPSVAGFEWIGTNNNIAFEGVIDTNHNGSPTSIVNNNGMRKKAGIPTDADFPNTPIDGTPIVDTTNNRLYVRVGGVWKYAALT